MHPLRDTLDHVLGIAGQDDLVEPFAVPHPEPQRDDGGAEFGPVGRFGTVAFEPLGEVVVGAPFEAVTCAGLRGAVVGAGAVDVDEGFAGVVFADEAEAGRAGAVDGIVVEVLGSGCWWGGVVAADLATELVRDGREVEE